MVFSFCIIVYVLFSILSSKKLGINKAVRQTAKKIKKHRIRYSLLNDGIWFTYLYAMFMAMLQFKQASTATIWDTINIVLACIVFVLLVGYTGGIFYLGNKYKEPSKKMPSKWAFLRL